MRYPIKKIVSLRPEDLPSFETAPDEWADNFVSNFFAWTSLNFLGPWCSTPEHWTSRITHYLMTTCPCCLLWRGIMIGACIPGFFVLCVMGFILL